MKKKHLSLSLAGILFGFCFTACGSARGGFRTVEAGLAERIAASKTIVVLDVRTPEEFADGHLPNAVNIDFLGADFRCRLNRLDKGAKYLVYCRSGQRSTKATGVMEQLGFKNVTNMLGGILQWKGPIIK